MHPDPKQPQESRFGKVYAVVFLTVMLAVLGGGICVWLGQHAVFAMKTHLSIAQHGGNFRHDNSVLDLFYNLGITDWRAQFGIGAVIGVACAGIYFRKNSRKIGE